MNGPISLLTRCLKGGSEVVKGQRLAHRPPAEKKCFCKCHKLGRLQSETWIITLLQHYFVEKCPQIRLFEGPDGFWVDVCVSIIIQLVFFTTFVCGYSCDLWSRAKKTTEKPHFSPQSAPHEPNFCCEGAFVYSLSPYPAAGRQILCCASSSCPSPGRSSADWTRPAMQKDKERTTC